jgi:hypothetical protein
MKAQRRWMVAMFTLALLATSAVVVAQDKAQEKGQKADRVILDQNNTFVRVQGPEEHMRMPAIALDSGATSIFVSSEMGFDGKVVKGVPYSAQAVTESVQVLADGNRIVRKSSASVYRDSEGRTRRDQSVGNIGPYAVAGAPPQTIFINDPVANVNYILDPRSHTARKMSFVYLDRPGNRMQGAKATMIQVTPPASIEERQAVEIAAAEVAGTGEVKARRPMAKAGVAGEIGGAIGGGPSGNWIKKEPVVEALGKQLIEGVEAEGTRSTLTIAAGEIGNELPIQIISERWHSPELQQVVMSKHSDPRFGETTYRLTAINRAEPARTLFEIPSEYTFKESMRPDLQFKVDAELQRARKKTNENEQ